MTHKKANILIIIVNYRTGELVTQCLESLKSTLDDNVKVIVVDNCSSDNSVELIGQWIAKNKNSYFLCSEQNTGFSGGNNLAIEYAKKQGFLSDYVWLLNPDTVVRENALQALVSFMQENATVGITGSRLEDLDGTAQCSAFRFHSILSELDNGLKLGIVSKLLKKWQVALPISESPVCVDWVAGASMLIRQEVFNDIGLFDDNYFLYFEETDFCFQAKKVGWLCWYIPGSHIVHFAGSSTGVTNNTKRRRPRYWFESRRRYFLKNHGAFYLFLANFTWASAFLLFRIRQLIQNKPDDSPEHLLRDFISFNFFNK
jgi:N-acetylglucosaminyl-diphospho-decaprenol L-rhamnosyltransferase